MNAQQVKNSILQIAIQGRLVPQNPTDEPASALLAHIGTEKEALVRSGKIRRERDHSVIFQDTDGSWYERIGSGNPICIVDKVPFEIPSSWGWAHLSDISYPVGTKKNQILARQILETGDYAVVTQGQDLINGFSNEKDKVIDDLPLIMFGDHTRNVKLINFKFIIGADGTKFHKIIGCNDKYIYYWMLLAAFKLRDRGYERHHSLLKSEFIPIPPLAEQNRIVEKIEEILLIIEKI